MRKLMACAVLLLAPGALAASAITDDFVGPLSSQTYEHYVDVSGDNLTCQLSSSGSGYVPIEWAYATLNLEAGWDQAQILAHPAVNAYATEGSGDPRALCAAIAAVKAQADESGYLTVEKTSVAEVRLQQSYGQGCIRVISETITIKFSDDLALTNESYKILSGEYAPTDCR